MGELSYLRSREKFEENALPSILPPGRERETAAFVLEETERGGHNFSHSRTGEHGMLGTKVISSLFISA